LILGKLEFSGIFLFQEAVDQEDVEEGEGGEGVVVVQKDEGGSQPNGTKIHHFFFHEAA
jgi:hypothetical protein